MKLASLYLLSLFIGMNCLGQSTATPKSNPSLPGYSGFHSNIGLQEIIEVGVPLQKKSQLSSDAGSKVGSFDQFFWTGWMPQMPSRRLQQSQKVRSHFPLRRVCVLTLPPMSCVRKVPLPKVQGFWKVMWDLQFPTRHSSSTSM